jgi:hypothetical protein
MKALRLPAGASTVAYFVRFRRPHDPPVFVSAKALLEGLEAPSWPGHLRAGRPQFRLTSRGRQWDLSGLQVIHSVPLLRSQTPVELVCPCLSGHTGAAPRFFKSGGFGRQEKFRGSLTQLRHLLSYACRVDEEVTPLAPHRSGRAQFEHTVPHARVSFHPV